MSIISFAAVCAALIMVVIVLTIRIEYTGFRKFTQKHTYQCMDFETLSSVYTLSDCFSVNLSDWDHAEWIEYAVLKRNDHSLWTKDEYYILLTFRDWVRFNRWYRKLLKDRKKASIIANSTNDVLSYLQEEIDDKLRASQKVVAEAMKQNEHIVSEISKKEVNVR